MRWPWQRRRVTHDEAREQLEKLCDRDAEVDELARQLVGTERRNNFSGMVDQAIHRAVQAGR